MTDRDIWAYRADAGVDDHHLGGYSFETSDGVTGHVVDEVKGSPADRNPPVG